MFDSGNCLGKAKRLPSLIFTRTHFEALFQYGCQFTKNESLVEDALQDMFIELREKRKADHNSDVSPKLSFYLFEKKNPALQEKTQ